jgi:hypothetical protein
LGLENEGSGAAGAEGIAPQNGRAKSYGATKAGKPGGKKKTNNKPSSKSKAKRGKKHTVADGVIDTRSRTISAAEWKILWSRAAGRCQFNGCNKVVYRAPVSNQLTIIADHSHVIGFSDEGPRGGTQIEEVMLNRYPNLMLLCKPHHKNIDDLILQHGYTVAILRAWKERHEARVEAATEITDEVETHVITYFASIANDIRGATEQEVRAALHPFRFPSPVRLIALGHGTGSGWRDYEGDDFWRGESRNLEKVLLRWKETLKDDDVQHFSVFAIAPQPLLIFLGTMLPELKGVDIYNRHKFPQPSWKWPDADASLQKPVNIVRPPSNKGRPALVLEFSASVNPERILRALPDADVFKLTVDEPGYDSIRSRDQLVDFHKQARRLLDEIKYIYGETTPLCVFPAGPVAISTEFGKVRAPKSDTTWILYDQINEQRGFQPVLELSAEGVKGCQQNQPTT